MTDRALAVVPDQGRAVDLRSAAGTMELALMDDGEFAQRLEALKRGKTRIQQVQRGIMTKDIDYGVVPGTNKPTLLKPGAEALCSMYRLVPTYDVQRIVGDGTSEPNLTYVVTCSLHPGNVMEPAVGSGVGECNSWEDKYRYRNADHACPECGTSAIRRGAKQYGGGWFCDRKKGGCGAKYPDSQFGTIKMDNPDPFSLGNTILKMSKKRAYVDATLEALDASDLFTQDIGDPEPELPPAPPRGRTGTAPAYPDVLISQSGKDHQAAFLADLRERWDIGPDEACEALQVGSIGKAFGDKTFAQVIDLLAESIAESKTQSTVAG